VSARLGSGKGRSGKRGGGEREGEWKERRRRKRGGGWPKGRGSEKIGKNVKLIYLISISLALAANITCYDWT